MKRIVQAFQYIFVCIALSSVGMSSLMGAAESSVDAKMKNALHELATAYNKGIDKSKAQETLKELLMLHKDAINKDLKFTHTPYKENSSPLYSFFGSDAAALETDISLSVIMFALIYVPQSLRWFNTVESENRGMLFEISESQRKYLNL